MSTQQISTTELAFDPMDLISGEYFAANGYPHRQWTHLRKHAPVFRVEGPKVAPFWAITKHADIIEISKRPRLWLNGPRLAVFEEDGTRRPEEAPLKHLLNMDPPEHAEYRSIVSRSFTPRGVSGLEPEIENITARCSTTSPIALSATS